ncbi:MAG: phenylalanine--tRNA ligase beta subunit-related protein [Vicinamibacterales bacterium]
MTEAATLRVDAAVAGIVRPASGVLAPVRVVARESLMDAPLEAAAAAMRRLAEAPERTAAVRTMYKRVGIDPTKTRPSSEALLRRVRKGDPIPRINSLVDVVNWTSLETQLPFGLYDLDAIETEAGTVALRLGRDGEAYPGIRKDAVHVGGRLVLADALGAFGNPTSDSARTMVTERTTRALVVIFAPVDVPAAEADRALALTRERAERFCAPRPPA